MAMSAGTAEGDLMMEINTTPLIDVMLVLLTLLILTLPPQTHAVKLDMPRPNNTPPPTQPQVVDLLVDFDGSIYWNNTPVNRATLQSYFRNAANSEPQPEIHLAPNPLAKYETVAIVLGDAQRLGVTKIGFSGIDQYQ
jgi:biopolymer transport protein ExbD